MEDEIVLAGKKYVSSKRAAEISGYAKDYVGQLCRGGKLSAKLIGRNWYILIDSLEKITKKPEQEEKTTVQSAVKTAPHPRTTLLDDLNPSFYTDDTPLMPNIEKSEEVAKVSISQVKEEQKTSPIEIRISPVKPKIEPTQTISSREEEEIAESPVKRGKLRLAGSALVLLLLVSFAIAGFVYPFTGSVVSYGKEGSVTNTFFVDTQLANALYSQYTK